MGKPELVLVKASDFNGERMYKYNESSDMMAKMYVVLWDTAKRGELLRPVMKTPLAKDEFYVIHKTKAYGETKEYDEMLIPGAEYLMWKIGNRNIDYSLAIEIEDVVIRRS